MKQLLSIYIMITSLSIIAMEEKPKLTVTLIAGTYKHKIMEIEKTAQEMWDISGDNNRSWYQVPPLLEYKREFKDTQETIYYGYVVHESISRIPYCAPKSAFSKEDQAKL